MPRPNEFIDILKGEFPEDRLTFQKAIATFHPESAREAADFFALANKHKQASYITGFGNNIDPIDEPFLSLVVIRTDRLNQLLQVEPENYFVEAGAGYPLRELNIDIKPKNLFLPHSDLPYVGSVGGAVAVNLSATYQQHQLPIKRYLIKAEIVTPSGEIITPGSVGFKSVAGYDIVKIFAPSWGLLGLLVSATLRVMPSTGREDYGALPMCSIDRALFLQGLDEANESDDAKYNRKIKQKFDPNGILPVI